MLTDFYSTPTHNIYLYLCLSSELCHFASLVLIHVYVSGVIVFERLEGSRCAVNNVCCLKIQGITWLSEGMYGSKTRVG